MDAERPSALDALGRLGSRTAPLGTRARVLAGLREQRRARAWPVLALVVGLTGAAAAATWVGRERRGGVAAVGREVPEVVADAEIRRETSEPVREASEPVREASEATPEAAPDDEAVRHARALPVTSSRGAVPRRTAARPAAAAPRPPEASDDDRGAHLVRDAQRAFAAGAEPTAVEGPLLAYLAQHPRGTYEEEARYYLFLVAARARDREAATRAAHAFLAPFPDGHRAQRVRAWLAQP